MIDQLPRCLYFTRHETFDDRIGLPEVHSRQDRLPYLSPSNLDLVDRYMPLATDQLPRVATCRLSCSAWLTLRHALSTMLPWSEEAKLERAVLVYGGLLAGELKRRMLLRACVELL